MHDTDSKTTPIMGSPKKCAQLAGVSTRTITRLCENGTLQAVRFGRVWRVNMASFMRYMGIDPEEVGANA